MYKITLKCGDHVIETEGCAGFTSPRDLQQLAAAVFGEGAKYTVNAPSIGLYGKDTARA